MNKIQIFAKSKYGGEEEITDLYWFEELGIHWFDDKSNWGPDYEFRIVVDGKEVYSTYT